MTDSILQSFLDCRFIRTDDPAHIGNLKKASSAVQKLLKLKKNKPKIIEYTLVALDPTVPVDNPIIVEVEALVRKQWPTFRNSVTNTKDTPIAYIQAVILDALSKLSTDENYISIIWHTGCNIISYYRLAGQEEILTEFLREIGQKVENLAYQKWNGLDNVETDTIIPTEITSPKITQGIIDEDNLRTRLSEAANVAWNANWPDTFANQAAKELSDEINSALTTQYESSISLLDFIQESVNTYLTDSANSFIYQNIVLFSLPDT